MSDSYLVNVYEGGGITILGTFPGNYYREARWKNGVCTLVVSAESIEEAIDKARVLSSFRLVKEGEAVGRR